MKKSGSRASKISTDAQDSLENSFPGIPDAKWHDFLEKEETDLFILGLREEIIQKCMEVCFDSYLEKQAVAFTVHCAYLAWCKVLNVFYMVRDPGDSDDSKQKKSWEPDLEPEPSMVDSWGSQCIQPMEPEPPAEKPSKEMSIPRLPTPKASTLESVESCSFMSDFFDIGEGEFFSAGLFDLSKDSSSTRSLLSDICMPPKSPPGLKPFQCCGKLPEKDGKKKKVPII